MKKLPVGVEDFKELVDKNFYLVDKTELINKVLDDKVSFYTRPRRFGKTLNMSMLRYFFDIKEKDNAYLFDHLKIHNYPETLKHQNQYPVIFVSLKDMERSTYDEQLEELRITLHHALEQYSNDLINSSLITEEEKSVFIDIMSEKQQNRIITSLRDVSAILFKHYHQKVMILIDEYDVPLQSAYRKGYYNQMVDFLKTFFSSALKTNPYLEKGIMTGCLRIGRESIFTGLNNFKVHSIFDEAGGDCFGFTIEETKQLLSDYDMLDSYDSIKEWYDGYLFGSTEIYNPWSVVLSVDDRIDQKPNLVSYWANTSSNVLVYDYIRQGNRLMKADFQTLVQGKSIIKRITPELTYRDMDEIENIYSFLLFTGYLKVKSIIDKENDQYELVLPNKEVKKIFFNQYTKYFGEIRKDKAGILYDYLINGNTKEANELLNKILISSISFFDRYESFYHGFMTGLFSDYFILSNREEGLGRYDLFIREDEYSRNGIVIECKYSKKLNELESDSQKAVEQLQTQKYIEGLIHEGYKNIQGYGISFFGKICDVKKL